MKIRSYTFCFPDEIDILENCLNSLSRFTDEMLLIDGGVSHAFVHHLRYTAPVIDWLNKRREVSKNGNDLTWNGVPLLFMEHEYVDPGSQRNFALDILNSRCDKDDWIAALDSDEVESIEAETQMRSYLSNLPDSITNLTQPLLSLISDEQHCAAGHHSTWLAHSRLHRPAAVHYNLGYHEHQTYTGIRVQWDARIIHTRMLYRRRIWLQRGAATLRSAWDDLQMVDVPAGITWHPLTWPEEELRGFPFDEDIRGYEGGRYAK